MRRSAWTGCPRRPGRPSDWTTTDDPPVTALQPTAFHRSPPTTDAAGTTAFAVDGPVMPAMPPTPQSIAPGWYPDPQDCRLSVGGTALAWTEHSAPVGLAYAPPRPRPGYQATRPPLRQHDLVVMAAQKSVGRRLRPDLLLRAAGDAVFDRERRDDHAGRAGSSAVLRRLATFGLGLIVLWPLVWVTSIIWGCVAAATSQRPVINTYYR